MIGNYSYCRKIEGLNQVIPSTLNNICISYINNFQIISSLDKLNIYETNDIVKVIRENKSYKFGYIIREKLDTNKLDFTVKYQQNKESITKEYEIEPIELPSGD